MQTKVVKFIDKLLNGIVEEMKLIMINILAV